MQNIRIGLDVLMLVSGAIAVATTGNPFVFALAMADIGLATTDLAVQSFREEIKALDGGKEFLETWEKIYLVGSAITAAPALISSFLRMGVKVLNAASLLKSAHASKFITTCFTKIFLEIRIANFIDNTVKNIVYADRAITGSGLPLTTVAATRLQQEGVMFVRSLNAQKETIGIAAVYRGEVIAAGKATRIKELLKDVWSANGAALTKELEALWQMVPKLDESKKFWAAVNRAGNECRWDNQLGNTAESIEAATKSKDLGKVWEGEVGKAVQEFEKVLNFGSPVEAYKNGQYLKRAGDYDILTDNYLIECKLKYRTDIWKQLDKYTNEANPDFMNFNRKKVVLVIKSIKSLPHSFLNELAKRKIILIQGINQLKKLKTTL